MSEHFKNGGSHLESKVAYDEYTAPSGRVGYGASDNDPKGSCYWADKDNMDPIWQYHDSNIAEHELGFNEGSMSGNSYVRVDCEDLSPHNQRIANGYEQGANENFTGIVIDEHGNKTIDPTVYNQRTSGGQPECVTDQLSTNDCKCSEPQRFDDPNLLSSKHCNKADAIASMPDGDTKNAKLDQWNSQADALKNRISSEQDYLKSRINDHEKRMSQFTEGSLEYNRAQENRKWCQNYYNDLEASKSNLQAKQNMLNNSNSQVFGELPTPQHPEPNNNPQISGTLPNQAQGIELPNNQADSKSGKDLVEDATKKNSDGFDTNNAIS